MLVSALELITQAASNSLFIFCFFNLIIVMILMGSKPISSFEQENENHTPVGVTTTCAYTKQETNSKHSFQNWIDVKELSSPQQEEAADTDAEEEDINENSSSEEDDELRRRVEEFIEKVNRGWKEERLRTDNHLLV